MMETNYSCEQNYEKVISDSLGKLPNEVILNIFTHLTIKDLGRCAQVSKNFWAIAYDKSFWTKVLVTSGTVSNKLLEQALSRGLKYLGLSRRSFFSTLEPNYPPTNQIEYLALRSSLMDEKYFRQFLLSCHNLKKLSVNFGDWKSDDLTIGILQNSNSLKVLDLSGCFQLDSQDLKSIVSRCLELTDANFDYLCLRTYNLASIFSNLTPNIKKLSLSGAALRLSDLNKLITRCNKITDLDLSWALLFPDQIITNIKFPRKIQLESLYLRGFDRLFDITFSYLEMFILSCEKSLQFLDISFCKKMTFEAIQLIVSRCLNLTAVDFRELKHTSFICKNLTPNIVKVSLSSTDVSNEDIKTLVSRCNKIQELDISHTHVVIDAVVDEIILHLSSTLEKLSLTMCSSKFSLFKLCSMPKFKNLSITPKFVNGINIHKSEMEIMIKVWKKQFPSVVISCVSLHGLGLIIPNIAKPMLMEETIWEIECEGIQLSD